MLASPCGFAPREGIRFEGLEADHTVDTQNFFDGRNRFHGRDFGFERWKRVAQYLSPQHPATVKPIEPMLVHESIQVVHESHF